MPLYDYQCTKCGNRFERIQKFSDPLVEECPECGGKVEQLLSPPAIQFKGSGWYITDYSRKSSPSSSGNGKKSDVSASSDSGTESKPESKPAASTESKADSK